MNANPAFEGEFELIDWGERLLPFKTRKGLCKWGVYDSIRDKSKKRDLKLNDKKQESINISQTDDCNQCNQISDIKLNENQDALDLNNLEEKKEMKIVKKDEMEEENKQSECSPIVFDEYFREYNTAADIPLGRKDKFKATFFPPNGTEEEIDLRYHLSRCARVFPHDQDTSGFFIALFKRNPIKKNVIDETKIDESNNDWINTSNLPIQKPLKNLIRWDPNDPDIEYIKTYYGLTDDFPLDQIFTYSKTMNKLIIVNKGLSDLLYADQSMQLNFVSAGAEAFIRNSSKNSSGTEWIYRISQDGVYHIYPFMTKRIIKVDIDIFLSILNTNKLLIEEIWDSEFKNKIKSLSQGWFVIITQIAENKEEALVLHRHFDQINTMVSELNLFKLRTCLNKDKESD